MNIDFRKLIESSSQIGKSIILIVVYFFILTNVSKSEQDTYTSSLNYIIEIVNNRNYDELEIFLSENPEFVNYTNHLSCTIICEFTQLMRDEEQADIDSTVDLEAIKLALQFGSIPNSSTPVLNLLNIANDINLALTDVEQLPVSTGECLIKRDLLIPLVHELASLGFEYRSTEILIDNKYSHSTIYIYQLCFRIFHCSADYEIAPEGVIENLRSALSDLDKEFLIRAAIDGVLEPQCVSSYVI